MGAKCRWHQLDQLDSSGNVEEVTKQIAAIMPASKGATDLNPTCFDVVAPGFIDLQINGAGGVLFNDQPDADAIDTIAAAARKGGLEHTYWCAHRLT